MLFLVLNDLQRVIGKYTSSGSGKAPIGVRERGGLEGPIQAVYLEMGLI